MVNKKHDGSGNLIFSESWFKAPDPRSNRPHLVHYFKNEGDGCFSGSAGSLGTGIGTGDDRGWDVDGCREFRFDVGDGTRRGKGYG